MEKIKPEKTFLCMHFYSAIQNVVYHDKDRQAYLELAGCNPMIHDRSYKHSTF